MPVLIVCPDCDTKIWNRPPSLAAREFFGPAPVLREGGFCSVCGHYFEEFDYTESKTTKEKDIDPDKADGKEY